MRPDFAEAYLRCPVCSAQSSLSLLSETENEREVRSGQLRCRSCGTSFPVRRGVAELLVDPPEHVAREAAGLERFAETMRAAGWDRERILALPDVEDGYWYAQARSMNQLLSSVDFQPGQSLLDVGSNTCWAANRFAEAGLQSIALDIATTDLQGLYTADIFIDAERSFFERILGTMNDIPLASSSLDYVYCCEVLHHNDALGLRQTIGEAFRVLKPGGKLLIVNETLKTLRDRSGVHTEAVAQYDGYEHAHWAMRYRLEAVRAGFSTRLLEPHYRPFFGDQHLYVGPGAEPWRAIAGGVGYGLRRSRKVRRAYLLWLNHVVGGVMFGMIATKPPAARRPRPRPRLTGSRRRVARSG